jgi:hypothetical protein
VPVLPSWHVFYLSVEIVPVMACCGQPAGCGMLVAGGFCYGSLLDERLKRGRSSFSEACKKE